MPTKTYQGYVYEQQADGSWARTGPAQGGPAAMTIGRPDPYRASEESRRNEDQDFQRRQVVVSEQNAAVTAANADKPPVGYERMSDDSLRFIPGGPADPAKIGANKAAEATATKSAKAMATDPDRAAQILTALENIEQLRGLSQENLAVGKFSERVSDWPLVGSFLGQNRADVEGSLKMVQGDLIQQQIAKLSAINGGNGVATMANSETEAARMAASVANLDPNQNSEQFQIGLDRAEAFYRRQLDGMKAASGVPEPKAAGAGVTDKGVPIPAEMQAEHMAYLRQNWGKLTPEGYASFRSGLDRKYDFEPNTEAYRETADPLNQRAAQGGSPDNAFIPPPSVPMSEGEQVTNDFLNTGAGRFTAAALNAGGAGIPGMLAGDQMDAMREESSGEMFAGDVLGGLTGAGMVGGLLGKVAPRLANPMLADATYGTIYGGMEGEDPVTGALMGLTGSVGGNLAGRAAGRALPRLTGAGPQPNLLTAGERATYENAGDLDDVALALFDADQLNVPMSLADSSPGLNSLAGAAARHSPTVAGDARDMVFRRGEGQDDRLLAAVERDLGPVANIPQRSEDLVQSAKAKAGPLYDAAYAAPGVEDLDLSDLMARPSMKGALARAYRIAQEEGRNPDELGFVFNDAGEVVLSDAGRFTEARGPRPTGGSAVISGKGNRAPNDLVSFVRDAGGLRDSSGELKFMGMGNEARRGTAMAGRDAAKGRLINNENGLNFDDMAEAAWEAGYFGPVDGPRPSTSEFLAALGDTYTGARRSFSIFDEDVVARYNGAEDNLNDWRSMEGEMLDNSAPAGPDAPFAPADAYGSVGSIGPSWQTLDYVKRGLDDVVEGYRDKTSGKLVLDTEGRAVNDTLRQFIARVDDANPDYAAARAAYAGPVQERAFMERGQKALTASPDQLGVDMARLTPEQQAQMRLGYQERLANRGGDMRNNSNPWGQLNTPNTEQRLGTMYGGDPDADIANLLMQRDLEMQLAGSGNRLVGNSMTAERGVADQAFKTNANVGGDAAAIAAETMVSGAPWISAPRAVLSRFMSGRRDAAAMGRNQGMAEDIGALLLDDSPAQSMVNLSDLEQRAKEEQALLEAVLGLAGQRGSRAGAALGAASSVGVSR